MATRNDAVVIEGSEAGTFAPVKADVIFCRNSDKNRKITLIRMWANARGHKIALCKDGSFCFLQVKEGLVEKGKVIDFDAVLEEINTKLVKSLNVSLETTQAELSKFKGAKPKAFDGVKETKLEGDKIRLKNM
ncbi:hypothetical protein [Pleurocapsa sp. CCALA 161]|uniref:hypothetical protein n=1 Tax=Pleurocapsa sp. CCALA 161 TaxID=2107688 RepID=UPI0011B29847|nr:hypothetical protein [Pleurocapsa sp. CCALA 161]